MRKLKLDYTYINEVCGDELEFKQNLLSTFVSELEKDRQQINSAFKDNNDDELKKVLHKLKYKINLFKANELLKTVERLEKNITIEKHDKDIFLDLFGEFTDQISKQLK
ncbi:MAG: Hpt domain-containing protein [Flavobacteriales bacterium]|nr:Hpt domain-containing protein [Flavobacteriales bacterium]